jgi:hypothetical protein
LRQDVFPLVVGAQPCPHRQLRQLCP